MGEILIASSDAPEPSSETPSETEQAAEQAAATVETLVTLGEVNARVESLLAMLTEQLPTLARSEQVTSLESTLAATVARLDHLEATLEEAAAEVIAEAQEEASETGSGASAEPVEVPPAPAATPEQPPTPSRAKRLARKVLLGAGGESQ